MTTVDVKFGDQTIAMHREDSATREAYEGEVQGRHVHLEVFAFRRKDGTWKASATLLAVSDEISSHCRGDEMQDAIESARKHLVEKLAEGQRLLGARESDR